MSRAVLSIAAVVAGSGCGTVGTFHRADTLGAGKHQLAVEPQVKGFNEAGDPINGAAVAFSYRGGVSDTVDMGLRLNSFAELELISQFQLTPRDQEALVVSLAPTLSTHLFPLPFVFNDSLSIPLLVGMGFGDGHQLILGPRVQGTIYPGEWEYSLFGEEERRVNAWRLSAGSSLGLAVALNDRIQLLPEASAMTLVASKYDVETPALIWHGGVGVLFRPGR